MRVKFPSPAGGGESQAIAPLANIANRKYNGLPMIKGYILIKLLPGFESSAMSQVRATSGVLEVNSLFGHWDAIAIAEAKSLHDLSRLVLNQIRGIQGVQDTETLVHGEF